VILDVQHDPGLGIGELREEVGGLGSLTVPYLDAKPIGNVER
jgi:hypothetical protein